MRIDSIQFGEFPVFLAPMEDISDPPFRILCKEYGADLLYTEFISSGGLVHASEDSLKKLEFDERERPIAIQIFGGDVEQVRDSVSWVNAVAPDIIDINFGCPVKKVVCRDAGAGILKDLKKMRLIAEAVVAESSRPVTVKTRLGWSDSSIQILGVAQMLQDCGIKALAVHARTRAQMYKGEAQWQWLRRVKEDPSIQIPIIGNGDATTPELIREMFMRTGVDAVMVGRGAIGNPWIFREARALLETGVVLPPPSLEERLSVVIRHLELKCRWLGERVGVLEMRRTYSGYFRGLKGGNQLRKSLMNTVEKDRVIELLINFSLNGDMPRPADDKAE